MEFIEKHKALIITLMLMGIMVLSLYNITMFKKKKENAEIMMELPQELLEEMEKEEEEEPMEQEERELIASKRTHSAFNEDFENHDDVEERIKSLIKEEEASEETEASEEMIEGEEAIKEEINTEEKEEINNEEEQASVQSNNRNSSVTFTLKGREKREIPNPIYTCNGSGKVVVNIEVNQYGNVIDAKINKKRSSTRNECLFDNALEYAMDAFFSTSNATSQKGLITYYFNYTG